MFHSIRLVLSALVIVLAACSFPHSARAQSAPAGVKNVVLVHGAFADGSSWGKVISLLLAKELNVIAVQLPLTSLADDVAATKRALAKMNGPVLLVGHSWGGMVITEAGNDPKVTGLVYVAAFVPDAGQTLENLTKDYPASPAGAEFRQDAAGFLTLSPKGIDSFFVPDLPAGERQLVYATQGPWMGKNFVAKPTQAAWKTKPSWAVVASDDLMIHPDQQRDQARRIKATTIEVKSGHAPMLSQAGKVAAFILDAAQKQFAPEKAVAAGNQ